MRTQEEHTRITNRCNQQNPARWKFPLINNLISSIKEVAMGNILERRDNLIPSASKLSGGTLERKSAEKMDTQTSCND